MVIIGRSQIAGGGGVAPDINFEYSGQYIRRAEDNVIEFLSTGVLTIKKDVYTDLFLVGGGGGGVMSSNINNGGGGGGYTKTVLNVLLNKGTYNIEIGAGGAGGTGDNSADGGATSITGNNGLFAAADGGKHAPTNTGSGGNGGSGGGGGSWASSAQRIPGGAGGSDGASGGSGRNSGGTGQGTTTREFGEATGKLYSGGGGAGYVYNGGYDAAGGAGGAGGGGNGAKLHGSGGDGTPNTGGGGGGGFDYVGYSSSSRPGGSGGSGIICMRVHKE